MNSYLNLNLRLKNAWFGRGQAHLEDGVGQPVEEGQVAAVLVPPQIDVAVYR